LRLHPEVAEPLRAYFAGADSMQRLIPQAGSGLPAEGLGTVPYPDSARRGDETIAPRGLTDSAGMPAGPFTTLPRQFGRYRVEKLLGTGAMGAVYLAHDTQLARPVALKVPRLSGHEDSDIVNRLLREAKAAANLNHPNICRVYDAGVEAGTFYIAMEYIDGRLLSDFISPDHLQDERRSVNVVRKLAAALAEAHGKGIIHRDLKPANIIVNARGEPILTDFGLARLTDQPRDGRATQSGMLIGSPAYMSPEQANGDTAKIGPRSDIYSLGVLLFELLTSRLPFQGSVLTILSQITGKEPPAPSSLRPGLDPRLDFICQRLMAKQPEDRYASMTEVGQELQNWLKAAPLIVPPETGAATTGAAPATGGLKAAKEEAATAKKGDLATPAEVTQQERRAQKLMDEQNYDAAIPLLVKLSELEGTLFKDTAAWAKTTLSAAKQKQQKLRERIAATFAKARTLMGTYNYGEVAQMLDAIPAAARTDEVRQLLSTAGERFEDCLSLQDEIDTAVRAKNYERLLPLVKRFLKLKPDNTKMQRLAKDLARNRPERAVRNFKGTGKYFDVAGRLVETKEIVGGLCFIVALVVGVSYGAKYLGRLPAAGELLPGRTVAGNGAASAPDKEKGTENKSPIADWTARAPGSNVDGRAAESAGRSNIEITNSAKGIDLDKDFPIEAWEPETWATGNGWIVSPGDATATYMLPDRPPEEYSVSLRARRLTGRNMFGIGLPVGDKQVLVALDADDGTVSGLELLKGKPANNNAATLRGRLLLPDREVTIKCTVRKEGILCTCEGVKFLDWRGDLGELSLPPGFSVSDNKVLFVATVASRVAIRDVEVSPPEKISTAAWGVEADALIGTWTFARGLSLEGLRERWEIRKTKADWSVKRSFTDKAGKSVGAAYSENCVFSGGMLEFTQRFTKKPVAAYADATAVKIRLETGGSDRLKMNWSAGDASGAETLVRVSK